MKVSFSFPSKSSSSKPNLITKPSQPSDDAPKPEFVTEFDPSKTLTSQIPKHTIPRLENTWKPLKKMKNIDLPLRSSAADDPDLRFEVETLSANATGPDSSMGYGLNLRSNDAREEAAAAAEEEESKVPVEAMLLQKFKEDMEKLPEAQGLEEYEDAPVEGFGAALLGAYGWKEGQGIGRNVKKDVQVVQYVGRSGREGLGFEPEVKNDEKGRGREVLVAKKGPDGRTRHVVGIDEKLMRRELRGIHVGKTVRVVGGRHIGLKGKVLEKLDGGVVLNLMKSDEEIRVGISEVAELGSVEEERCLKKLKELEIRDERRDDRKRGYDDKKRDRRSDHESSKRDGGVREIEKRLPKSWLKSHIRVRIISKSLKGGRLYLKKGKVLDVVGPRVCDISMDESKEIIQGVNQDLLETALPRRGGPVLVLYGKHEGVFGDLIEKNSEKETGVIRDADSRALIDVRLEEVAEYLGDPSTIGY